MRAVTREIFESRFRSGVEFLSLVDEGANAISVHRYSVKSTENLLHQLLNT